MTGPGGCLPLHVYSAVRDERPANLGAKAPGAAAAAAAAAPASLPPGVSLTAACTSVGSPHGWHKRTGRRFVGDGGDCDKRRFLTSPHS